VHEQRLAVGAAQLERDVLAEQAAEQALEGAQLLAHVGDLRRWRLPARERQQAAGERRGLLDRGHDLDELGVAGRARRQARDRQTGEAAYHRQQVVEVVGHATQEAPDDLHLLRLAQLLLEHRPVVHVPQVDDDRRRPIGGVAQERRLAPAPAAVLVAHPVAHHDGRAGAGARLAAAGVERGPIVVVHQHL
jgi:hypothetical protein